MRSQAQFLILFASIVSSASLAAPASETNWAQPPVGCVEEIVPQTYDKACPDLSQVKNIFKDLPETLSAEEATYWQSHKKERRACSVREVLAREERQPKSSSAGAVEISWMESIAPQHRKEKIAAIYEASRVNHIPAQVLTGAIKQESLFAELGIAEDGANYSCGVGQINILEWCRWANSLSAKNKKKIGWPGGFECHSLETTMVKPYYEFAKSQLGGLPTYRMTKDHYKKMTFADVVKAFPNVSPDILKTRNQAIRSFIGNCSDPKNGIAAKAHELTSLYSQFVPAGLKAQNKYAKGDSFKRKCEEKSFEKSYPLDIGWLLAVGIYNAGPHAIDAVAYYNHWSREDMQKPATWQHYTPTDLIRDVYWSGQYDSKTDKLRFKNLGGSSASWNWTKPCVLQRHIARVVQNVTRSGEPALVDSLEGDSKCANSQFDPKTDELIKSAVPALRQHSLGYLPVEKH